MGRTVSIESTRRQIAGAARIESALRDGEPVQVLLVDREDASDTTQRLIASARAAGAEIWRGSPGDLRRMSRGRVVETSIAMLGMPPLTDLDGLLGRGGAVWLLHRATYPSNVGFALRTAEVSGAQGVIVDADFNHEDRSRVAHVSMGAHRMLPVLWESTRHTIDAARRRGHAVVALEDSGTRAPWEIDLRGPILLVVGNERDGIHDDVLASCDATIALPMAGFVPSYNLHAAIAAIAIERLRQLGTSTTKP
jgi:23S rRNA (guanosine2251-2'-O)-methyltransferase